MKIAIIGSGIAGNVVAHRLHREQDVTVFEAAGARTSAEPTGATASTRTES